MDDQVTPEQFIVFLIALAASGVLASIFLYVWHGVGPVAWGMRAWRWWRAVKHYQKALASAPHVMSRSVTGSGGSELVRGYAEPPEPGPVRQHQNQAEPGEPGQNEPGREPATLQNRDDLIVLLASLQFADGSYCLSANRIVDAVGGTASEIKARVRAVREPSGPDKPPASIRRPANGW